MVLADLGEQLTAALRRLNAEPIVDEKVRFMVLRFVLDYDLYSNLCWHVCLGGSRMFERSSYGFVTG